MNQINKYALYLIKAFWVLLFLIEFSGAQNFIWPTSASKLLTSGFAEYRPRRFHAGFDVKTWGKEGYPVFAMEDGYIWRLRISPKGYGKVLYVKHPNGYYTVYAHLQKFAPALEQFVRQKQLESGEYIQQFYFKPHQFPVKKGELIAYTGSTGIGYPHLHFEIRDSKHRPINPRFYFQKILSDKIYPKPLALAFVPNNMNTSINGYHEPLVLEVQRKNKNKFIINKPILVTGPFYMAIKVFDYMKGAFNRINVFQIKLSINNQLIEEITLDTLDYSFNHHSQLYFDYLLERRGYPRFQRLTRHPDFQLDYYKTDNWSIFLSQMKPGKYSFKIELTDLSGNRSFLTGIFYYQNQAPTIVYKENKDSLTYIIQSPFPIYSYRLINYYKHSPLTRKEVLSKTLHSISFQQEFSMPKEELKGFLGAKVIITTEEKVTYNVFSSYNVPEKADTLANIYDYSDMPEWYVFYLKSNSVMPEVAFDDYAQPYVLAERTDINNLTLVVHKKYFVLKDTLTLYTTEEKPLLSISHQLELVRPGQDHLCISRDSLWKVFFPAKVLYDSQYVELEILSSHLLSSSEQYPLEDKIYKLNPFFLKAASPFKVYLPFRKEYMKKHVFPVYFEQKKNQWVFLPSKITSDSVWFECPVYSAEYFSLAQDSIPPEIIPINVKNHQTIVSQNLIFKIRDAFAGIENMDQIRVFLNGKKQLFEWDPEEEIIRIPKWSYAKGLIRLNIQVVDNALNQATLRMQFRVE